MPAKRHPLRSWVVTMFKRGDLVSASEGAIIASVPRQTVARWLRESGINIEAKRRQYLARIQRRAQLYAEGKPQQTKPSKTELRLMAEKAVRDFNRASRRR